MTKKNSLDSAMPYAPLPELNDTQKFAIILNVLSSMELTSNQATALKAMVDEATTEKRKEPKTLAEQHLEIGRPPQIDLLKD